MSPTVYTASKPRHARMWRAMRKAGLNVIATWINYKDDTEVSDWEKLWIDCANEAAAADITLVYVEKGDELRGAYVEMGIAMASGKTVFLANPDGVRVTDAVHHPRVTEFHSLEEALDAIEQFGQMRESA
jgi:nucleoside 2-deoxyribosyltransferase